MYQDLLWLADGGQTPKVIPNLTRQIAGDIIQTMGHPSLSFQDSSRHKARTMPAPESPDYDPPLHPSPAKRPKPNEEAMRLHFANITSLGKTSH